MKIFHAEKWPKLLVLFLVMLKIGTFTFGGGWSIITQLQAELIEKRGWVRKEDLLDYTSVGRSVPGIMVINICVMIGYRIGGALYGAVAAVGVALPSIVVLSVVAVFYNKLIDNVYIARAMVGVRAAVVPIIVGAVAELKSAALRNKRQYAIAVGAFFLCLFTPVSNLLVVVLGAGVGLLWKVLEEHNVIP